MNYCHWLHALLVLAGYVKTHCFHTFTLSSGRLTTLSLRNFVGMKPATPLSRRVFTPMAWPGQEPLSKWFQTWSKAKIKSQSAWKHNNPGSSHSNKSKSCVSKQAQPAQTCGRAEDRGLQRQLPSNTVFLLQLSRTDGTLQPGTFLDPEQKPAARAGF